MTIVLTSCNIARQRLTRSSLILHRASLLHIGERRSEKAIEDILRIHKLARLGKRAKLVSGLVDNTHLEGHALTVGVKMLESTDLDRVSLKSYLNSLQQLGPVVTAKDLCLYHRLSHLASTSTCALKSPKTFIGNVQIGQQLVNDILSEAGVDDLEIEPMSVPHCCEVSSDQIDWDYLLHKINQRYDRAERIHALPDTTKRLRSIQDFTKETQQRKINFVDRSQFDAAREKNEQQARRQLTDDIDVVLNELLNFEQYSTYEELSLRAQLDLLRIMAAARLYEKLHGELPKTYEAIKDYFDEVLVDPFSEKPYRWKSTTKGLEVSSASNDYGELPRAFRELKVTVQAQPK